MIICQYILAQQILKSTRFAQILAHSALCVVNSPSDREFCPPDNPAVGGDVTIEQKCFEIEQCYRIYNKIK